MKKFSVVVLVVVVLGCLASSVGLSESAQEGKFSLAGINDEQEARDFFVAFQRAVVNNEKTKVADMVCYPARMSFASGNNVTVKNRKDFLKSYEAIFDTIFIDAIAKKTPDELWSNYAGVATSNGEIWFHKLSDQKDCKGVVKISAINNEYERSSAYSQKEASRQLDKEAKEGRQVVPEEQQAVIQEPVQSSANGVQGVMWAKNLPAIRKRVEKENKITSKRVNAKKPMLPNNLKEQAAVMQLALNTKSIIPDKGLVAECFVNGTGASYKEYVYCNMYFPGSYPVGGVPPNYVHYIELVTSNVVKSFRRGRSCSFDVSALVNIENGFVPVCRFIYDKEFDIVSPMYSVR